MRYYLLPNDIGLVIKLSRDRYIVLIDTAYVTIEEQPLRDYALYYCKRYEVDALRWVTAREDRSFKSVSREVLLTSSIPVVRSLMKKSSTYIQRLYDLNTPRVNPGKFFFYEDLMDL